MANVLYKTSFRRGIRGFRFRDRRWQYSLCHSDFFRATYVAEECLLQLRCNTCNKLCYSIAILPPFDPVFEHKLAFRFMNSRLCVSLVPEEGFLEELFLEGGSIHLNPIFMPRSREQFSLDDILDHIRVY